jgi:hypothetical protein
MPVDPLRFDLQTRATVGPEHELEVIATIDEFVCHRPAVIRYERPQRRLS